MISDVSSAPNAANVKADETTPVQTTGCCVNFFLYDSHRPIIQAFYLNQFGRSCLFVSFMFLSLGILELANRQAGCPIDEDTGSYACTDENKVYGARPSSMLTLMATIGGLATSVLMPYFGAIVDYSDYRRGFGRVCATLLVMVNFAQIFIYERTWFAMTILQSVVATSTFFANAMVMWSYVSAETDHALHGITASGRLWESVAMFTYFLINAVVAISSTWDAVSLARFAQALAVFFGAPTLAMAYRKRYPAVKAIKTLPEGHSLYGEGIRELWNTIVDLGKTQPATQRFLIMLIFLGPAMSGFTSLAITYLKQQLKLTNTEVVIFIMVNLFSNPIGVVAHKKLARRFGNKRNFCIVIANSIVITSLFLGLIAGPNQRYQSYAFAVLFGYVFGHYYPSINGYFVSLVPEDQATELWGWNMFAGVILSWAPPLIFTSINETTGRLRIAMPAVLIFLVAGFALALTIPETANGANAESADGAERNDVDGENSVDECDACEINGKKNESRDTPSV